MQIVVALELRGLRPEKNGKQNCVVHVQGLWFVSFAESEYR